MSVVFCLQVRVQFHLSAYSSTPLESSGCGFERQKQQRRPDLMVTQPAVNDQNNIFVSVHTVAFSKVTANSFTT